MTSRDESGWPAIAATGAKQAAHTLSFIVIGAGVSGLGAAVALRRTGHRVTLVESMDGLDLAPEHARGLRLPPNMTKILNRWGYGERLDKIGIATQQIGFINLRSGEILGTHRLVRDLVRDAGGEFFLTEHHRLLALLLEIARELNADIRFGCRVAQVGAEGNSVILESGETLTADVVVGADGVCGQSSIAVEPNHARTQEEAGFMTYNSVISADKIRANPELHQFILDVGETRIANWFWFGDQCSAMAYPTNAEGECALVIWLPDDGASDPWGDIADTGVVESAVAALQAEPRLRKLASLAPMTRVKTVSRPPLQECVHPSNHMLVIGEAAHPAPRGLYFGPSMSLEDAATLGKLFSHALDDAQIPSFLNAFTELRRPRCARMLAIDNESLSYITMSGPTAEERDIEFRRRTAAGQDALSPAEDDTTGVVERMWDDNREMFGYDTEDASDGWWLATGLLAEHARGIDLSASIKLGEVSVAEE
ncbi:unnamed protein product [Peniophora sp. CBMAI 1063]|nr:unnamed protein product [Peniophora sp. CBMAI 1063]